MISQHLSVLPFSLAIYFDVDFISLLFITFNIQNELISSNVNLLTASLQQRKKPAP